MPNVLNLSPTLFRVDIRLIVVAFVSTMLIGFVEEILCRGLIFRNFLRRYGTSKRGIYLSVIISSLIFGCMHLGNISTSPIDAILQQTLYAFSMGLVLSIIYLLTGNLLITIMAHGLFDFTDSLIPGLYNIPFSAAIDSDLILSVIVSVVFIVYSVILLKHYNVEKSELVKEFEV